MVAFAHVIYGVPSAIIGALIGYLTLPAAQKLVAYKCQQREISVPKEPFPKWFRIVCALAMAVITVIAITAGNVFLGGTARFQALFVVVFLAIALVVSLVDCWIHLIPNEMVLLLLALGLVYNLVFSGLPGLLDALIALGIAVLIFGGSSALFFLIKRKSGLGAGDLKYTFAICATVGTSGLAPFLCGMAAAILFYALFASLNHLLRMGDYFPMAAHLSFGFLVALLVPYVGAYIAQPLGIFMWAMGAE